MLPHALPRLHPHCLQPVVNTTHLCGDLQQAVGPGLPRHYCHLLGDPLDIGGAAAGSGPCGVGWEGWEGLGQTQSFLSNG